MKETLLKQDRLEIKEMMVEEIVVENGVVKGVKQSDGRIQESRAVILTSGTFMASSVLVGHSVVSRKESQRPIVYLRHCALMVLRPFD